MLCSVRMVVKIDAYPFGFILELNPKIESTDVNITNFLRYEYDEKFDLNMQLNIRERNIIFPADFRTKEEILAYQENQNMKLK